jgi:hypothetical protein
MIPRVAVAVLWLLAAVTTSAQGLSYLPSFGMSVAYDDNLYHRPVGEGDMFVRFSPRLDAAYRSGRLAITSRYALDADRFTRHPELTTAHGRQDAGLDARYDASRRLLVTGMAAFSETQTPSDLNEVTALTPGRARARRLVLGPSATYDVGSRTDASAGYTATLETLQGGVSVTTQNATAALEHRRSAASSVRVEYLEQRFVFAGVQANVSRALTAGWTREVTRGTTLTLRAGPRLTDGVPAPEIAASARHQLRAGAISVSYLQTQTTLIGLPGIAGVRSVTATTEGQPRPRLTLRAASGVLQTRQRDLSSLVYRVSASCAWTFASHLGIEAGYDMDLQRGDLYTATAAQNIGRHLTTVNLIVAQAAAGRRR